MPEGRILPKRTPRCVAVGTPRTFDFPVKDHVDIGEALGMLDFDAGGEDRRRAFHVLRGALARLHRALAQFMLDMHTREHGYTEVLRAVHGERRERGRRIEQLPKFKDDLFKIESDASCI